MTTLTLKLIAVISMLADHVGFVFAAKIPDFALALRLFGRLAFPIFCYLIAEGYVRTRNVKLYALRLLTFAALSEMPFDLMCGFWKTPPDYINYIQQNVFFTLFLGLTAIWALDVNTRLHKPFRGWTAAVLCMALAALIRADYGFFGVAFIIVFFLYRGDRVRITLGFVTILMARYALMYAGFSLSDMMIGRPFIKPLSGDAMQWALINLFAAVALPLIFMYKGRKGYAGRIVQWGFYAFYPAHMLALAVIYRLMYL